MSTDHGPPPHSAGTAGGEQTRASSAGGEPSSIEQRAREFLAAEFEHDGMPMEAGWAPSK